MKTFILLAAVAGCGKSTWANNFKKDHPNTFIVSSDELRKELGGDYQNFDHEKEVWELFFSRIEGYAKEYDDVTVIADSTNVFNKYRLYYGKNIKGFDKKVLLILKKNIDELLKQNLSRDKEKIVPEEVIHNMYRDFEEPSQEVIDCYDEVVTLTKWF
ncbi:MAG: AAA family ATPase [Bacilli bacterium]|nr:AAA family ATPase [Bacilli bacterium]